MLIVCSKFLEKRKNSLTMTMDDNDASKTTMAINKMVQKRVLCPRHPHQGVEGIIVKGFAGEGRIQFQVKLKNRKEYWITAQQATVNNVQATDG